MKRPVDRELLDSMSNFYAAGLNFRAHIYRTDGMIFGVAHYISRMSRYLTLHPGDVVWFGCDGPTVPALQPGDLVEVACAPIGVLSNRVVREA